MYNEEQLQTLKEILNSSPISISKYDIYGGKPTLIKYSLYDLFIEDNKLLVEYKQINSGAIIRFRLKELLKNLGKNIKSNSKTLHNMRNYVEKSDLKFGPALREFLDNNYFITDDSAPIEDEIEWLDKHVRRIRALIPSKMVNIFKRQFPGQLYEDRKDQWAFGFTLFFDEVDDIPQSLLSIKNKNGNSVNLETKSFSNTSYIARLVKNYPNKFSFGGR